MFVKHQRLHTKYQSITHQLLIHHPFTGTFTGTKIITNPIDSSPINTALARACGWLRSLRSANPRTRRDGLVHGRSVPLPVALDGDDYALVPPAAPSSSTDRLSISFSEFIDVPSGKIGLCLSPAP